MKTCIDCGILKELNEFYKTKRWRRNRCKKCHILKFMPPSGKINTGRFCKGNIPLAGYKKNNIPWMTGRKHTEETKLLISQKKLGRKQSSDEIEKRRKSNIEAAKKYAKYNRNSNPAIRWAKDILKRDNYMCQKCNLKDKKLHAHHIKSWKEFKDLRFDMDNGITLCASCHKKTHIEEKKLLTIV